MQKDLSRIIRGFKTGCNRSYRALYPQVPSVATQSPPTGQQPTPQPPAYHDDRTHGLLFACGFNDKLLLRDGQLQRWLQYLHDNPRRLLLLSPFPHHNERILITRAVCEALNGLAWDISQG